MTYKLKGVVILERQRRCNYFYRLDCKSGEGLINPLLPELKIIPSDEFNFYLRFILQKCINVNRSFSDAVEFLSIWLEKSPDTLLESLKSTELKQFFNRTEYGIEGDQWYFPKLLQRFATFIEKKQATTDEILDYLFETFDFFSIPETFVRDIIGYDRLERCIEESPSVFNQALLLKISEFIKLNKKIDIGLHSRRYLNCKIRGMEIVKKRAHATQADRATLISYIKNHLFNYPRSRQDDQSCPYNSFNSPTCHLNVQQ